MPTGIGGEIAWWCPSLDNAGNGTTTLTDLVGNVGRNGTLTNMDPATDWVSDTANGGVRALDFDGTNDVVNATIPSTSRPCTVSLWNRIDGFPNSFPMWLGGGGLLIGVALSTNAGASFFASGQYFAARYVNVANAWQHLCYTCDATSIRLYVNGVLQDTKPYSGPTGMTAVTIGSAGTFPFRGRLDDIRILNRVITGAEITALATKRGYEPLRRAGGPINSQALIRPADVRPQQTLIG